MPQPISSMRSVSLHNNRLEISDRSEHHTPNASTQEYFGVCFCEATPEHFRKNISQDAFSDRSKNQLQRIDLASPSTEIEENSKQSYARISATSEPQRITRLLPSTALPLWSVELDSRWSPMTEGYEVGSIPKAGKIARSIEDEDARSLPDEIHDFLSFIHMHIDAPSGFERVDGFQMQLIQHFTLSRDENLYAPGRGKLLFFSVLPRSAQTPSLLTVLSKLLRGQPNLETEQPLLQDIGTAPTFKAIERRAFTQGGYVGIRMICSSQEPSMHKDVRNFLALWIFELDPNLIPLVYTSTSNPYLAGHILAVASFPQSTRSLLKENLKEAREELATSSILTPTMQHIWKRVEQDMKTLSRVEKTLRRVGD